VLRLGKKITHHSQEVLLMFPKVMVVMEEEEVQVLLNIRQMAQAMDILAAMVVKDSFVYGQI
jgi:hypothetical protein